ncbi:unnamed protein product [Cuscuta europaea]|uniref:SKA complex subunit 1 homolog n=1 Tax=Cuscuta europaea TaxID=41803 RepID=A0A9P1ED39_CUSEU|nr:unnamed protein product [Cuscuta europaea]
MEVKEAGSSLDALISSFNARIAELQQLVIARNMYPASSISDLTAVDSSLSGLELQLENIRTRLREETEAIPKAKKLIEASLKQQKKLQFIAANVPLSLSGRVDYTTKDTFNGVQQQSCTDDLTLEPLKIEEPAPREKKGRAPPPLWYLSADDLNNLPSYMRGRLTLDKVNAAIDDIAMYAETNSQLIRAPRKKLAENIVEKAMELRDVAATEAFKGKHFFLESDIKGPSLKLDHTGKAILTILRHTGRVTEGRSGHNRVFILIRPQQI